MKTGGATGHPILSCAANVVMTAFEKFKIQALIDTGTLKLYDRWVDDTFVRNKTRDRDLISREFHSFLLKSSNLRMKQPKLLKGEAGN